MSDYTGLKDRRARARAANEPGIKVHGYEQFNVAGDHLADMARCQGCKPAPLGPPNPKGWDHVDGVKLPPVCTWADLSDEEIEASHRHWLGTR